MSTTEATHIAPTRRLVDLAISSVNAGETRAYLLNAATLNWTANEKTIRNDCVCLRALARGPDAIAGVGSSLKGINGFYRTRHALGHIEKMSPIVLEAVTAAGWWDAKPPSVLTCPEAELEPLSAFVVSTLGSFAEARLPRAYSLLTKWAHFCFPDSFVIYDAQAAASIQTWSYFTYPLTDPAGKRYLTAETWNPQAYSSFLDFYRMCWQCSSQEQRHALQTAADDMSKLIKAPVGMVDVIDKLLWMASGDPRKLGLL